MVKERWIETVKKADFQAWGKTLGVDPLVARVIRNRDVETLEEAKLYLYGSLKDLSDPFLMKDMKKGADLIAQEVIRVNRFSFCWDFDDDGIFAGQILSEGIRRIGGEVELFTPHRVIEGYGLNKRIIDDARKHDCALIVTCDNGIAALEEVAYAKAVGLSVLVTDHHEVQFTENEYGKTWHLPQADAVIDPKQPEDGYPFKELCGAGVAFRLIQVLYEYFDVPKEEIRELLEYVAIATVADVVPLSGENRILVREGLKRLRNTNKTGLRALMDVCELKMESVNTHHIGFVIGPCFNAVGRLSHVRTAFDLLETKDEVTAVTIAQEIRALNEERKKMTNDGTEEAFRIVEETEVGKDKIFVIYLPGVHESVVGIIAGKVKEKYNHPTFVFTDAEDCLKGSGRSIESYHMLNGLMSVKELMLRGGGHAMAAGLSILPENLEAFRKAVNERCTLTEDDLVKVVRFDARLPLSYISEKLIEELSLIEPFGTGNPRPTFARPHFKIRSYRLIGKEQNSIKLSVSDGSGAIVDAVKFFDAAELLDFLKEEYGESELNRVKNGFDSKLDAAFIYVPEINEYRDMRSIQIQIRFYCRIN